MANSNPGNRTPIYKQKVIRSQRIQLNKPITINAESMNDDGSESVEPMVENGQVVGIIHRCSCGKVTEIRFQMDDNH